MLFSVSKGMQHRGIKIELDVMEKVADIGANLQSNETTKLNEPRKENLFMFAK